MEWTAEQLKMHREAARLLEGIKNEAFSFVMASLNEGLPVTERDVVSLIRQRFGENFLVADIEVPIVAFGASAAEPHYAAPVKDSKVITRGNVLLIDLWGKIDLEEAPYADITWMAWTGGKIPADVQAAFVATLAARDAGIRFLEGNMNERMIGHEVDDVVRNELKKHGLDKFFTHGTGHHMDEWHVHGPGYNFKQKDQRLLIPGTCGTIEPGVYIPGKFGIRSECDILLKKDTIEVTTPLQTDWVRLD